MDATTATALVVACAESSLPRSAAELLMMAEELGRAADGCGIPKRVLVDAADKVSRADDARRLEAVVELRRAAAALGEQAATLSRACDGFGRLVAAIELVRASAEAGTVRRMGWAGRIRAWWSRRRQRKRDEEADLKARLLAKNLSSPHQGAPSGDLPAPGQVMDRMSAMHNCALLGSLALLPYLGPTEVLKPGVFSSIYRQYVGSTWAAFTGVSCSFARSRLKLLYARFSSRLGMLGVTILVILFCHWLLDPDRSPWFMVGLAVAAHIFFFVWAWAVGDL